MQKPRKSHAVCCKEISHGRACNQAQKEVFSVKEASIYAKVSRDIIDCAIRKGDLRAKNLSTGKHAYYRIRKEWLDEWLENDK